jgi:hypothetical protein
MSLNPFDAIEKLINEHGSAAILKERLELAADQFSALERELAKVKQEKQELEAANGDLRGQLQQRDAKIKALEQSSQQSKGDRSEAEERVLLCLMTHDGVILRQLAGLLSISEQVAKLHIADLDKASLIIGQHYMGQPTEWHLATEGRRYLAARNLLK